MTQFLALEDMIVATAEGVRPPERLTVSQAAEKYIYLNNPGSYVGPYLNIKAPYLVEVQNELNSTEFNGVILVSAAQCGKALSIHTPIATPSGWTTMGALTVGDTIFGSDGRLCRVVFATPVMHDHDCYSVEFDDGTRVIADAEHRWQVDDIRGTTKVIDTAEMAATFNIKTARANGRSRYAIPMQAPLQLPDVDLPVPPYLMGIWLGDGCKEHASLNLGPGDADEIMARCVAGGGGSFTHMKPQPGKSAVRVAFRFPDGRTLRAALAPLGVLCWKHIPMAYLRGSEHQRRELLRGLMDSDGHATPQAGVEFTTSVARLVPGIRELLNSLGIKHTLRCRWPTYDYKGEHLTGQLSYEIKFTIREGGHVFGLRRHIDRINSCERPAREGQTGRRWIRNVRPVSSGPVRCIQVDSPDHLFLAGSQMVPTHNTQGILNWVGYTAMCNPADMMIVQTAQASARDFSKSKLAKLFRDSEKIGVKRTPGRQNRNVFDMEFLAGWRLTLGWPTINVLSGKSIPRMALTDYDRMEQDIDGEGSPFDLGRKRTASFKRFGMTYAESTIGFVNEQPSWTPETPTSHEAPPVKGILGLYNRGDRRRWYWHCWQCATAFQPDFHHLVYPDTADHMEAAEAAVLGCPSCGFPVTPTMKAEWNAERSKWIKDGQIWMPDKSVQGVARRSDIASFWVKGVCAAFADWKTLVFNHLKATEEYEKTGDEGPLMTTVNVDQGNPYTYKATQATRLPEDLKARARDWGGTADDPHVPEGVRFILITVDVQVRSFVYQAHGFHANGDISLIDMGKLKHSERLNERGERLPVDPANYIEDWHLFVDRFLERSYPLNDGSGRRMQVKAVACDSGGRAGVTPMAYNFWRWLRDGDAETPSKGHHARFYLVKGGSTKGAPRIQETWPDSDRKDRMAGARGEIPILLLNTDLLKDMASTLVSRAISTDDALPGSGVVHFPKWAAAWLYTQLTAEVNIAGSWHNPSKRRNESWDLLVYAIALALSKMVRLEALNWQNPPGWADEWDRNDMVFGAQETRPFEREPADTLDLAALAGDLA